MLFLTYWFVTFVAIVLPAYWFIPSSRWRLLLLAVCCVEFHTHFAGPAGVLPIVVLGVMTYLIGLSRNRTACLLGIAVCAASLLFYKYLHFLCADVLAGVWYHGGVEAYKHLHAWAPEMPPLAISFFVFEFVHYLYDVRHGSPPLKSPLYFGLFAIFWPSIVAGPVKRYEEFVPALRRGVRRVCERDVAVGLALVGLGLVKKFIAENLTAYIRFHEPHFGWLGSNQRWWLFTAIAFRILLDFSGYSDMAIGFARLFGIRLPTNFNWPYLATNITDFWHRWHISLSRWIRDYIYIPIGGSRCGVVRKVFNGLFAFALCGLWHGAAWNFLVWGLYHGVGLAVCSNYRAALGKVGDAIGNWFACNRAIAWGLTMLFVGVGWLLFFYPLPVALDMIKLLFVGGTQPTCGGS